MNKLQSLSAAALLAVLPFAANAESDFNTNTSGSITASAKLDFQVVIPRVLFLQVGTGTNLADNTAVDMLTFTVPAANLGAGGAGIAATGGTSGASGVGATVKGNVGDIKLNATTVGAMNNGTAAETLSFTQIATTTSNTSLPAPALADGAGTAITLTATNKVVNQTATWTYNYANTAFAAAGSYGGAGVNNGRVTYTASNP
ncbi:hypothetical protein MNR01_11415 [Lysobacter sp. S4-A87]|uniref:hypothetical protein n=1 Tax=Lysobacter sp. S4-A87 TaxID=2925843 RepID=UPI001F537A6B|nr:hypothetical protein [Lysobacter sp. S4-A87]UNK48376.1 hypothetical protein MNR01_11415 [Lysobacter sp. S4-A87]